MAIEKTPFKKYELGENKQDVVSLKLNQERRAQLERIKSVIEQPKDSTAIWTLFYYASQVILETPEGKLLQQLFKNRRRNKRTGLTEFDDV